ncbi:uncharacterized protein [Arachis hypogaea]|uniref:uncharacterized protein isoform X2 n=1 Tax=Arachis hypogaea TaxID=3818 RepID=UPI000DED0762|nr:uncharacterized protein LOC112749917 isoform X2 [Arachis hypogaea]QHO11377.1 uncharacterized protein DS421_15g497560 [Arachis hypogaea]
MRAMEIAETPKLPLDSDRFAADSFVIHINAFSSSFPTTTAAAATTTTTTPPPNNNTRITLQRSLSRKGSQRGGERKVNENATLHDRDTATSSPKVGGSCTPEKAALLGVGSIDHSINPHIHHQIPVTPTGTTAAEGAKSLTRRNSFRRSSLWALDPRRVLLFFATLSSMGTMLLIYFTLAISKQNSDD